MTEESPQIGHWFRLAQGGTRWHRIINLKRGWYISQCGLYKRTKTVEVTPDPIAASDDGLCKNCEVPR